MSYFVFYGIFMNKLIKIFQGGTWGDTPGPPGPPEHIYRGQKKLTHLIKLFLVNCRTWSGTWTRTATTRSTSTSSSTWCWGGTLGWRRISFTPSGSSIAMGMVSFRKKNSDSPWTTWGNRSQITRWLLKWVFIILFKVNFWGVGVGYVHPWML